MNAYSPTPALRAIVEPTENAKERRTELFRRLDEAADVIAETLLEIWRREHRRTAAKGGALSTFQLSPCLPPKKEPWHRAKTVFTRTRETPS